MTTTLFEVEQAGASRTEAVSLSSSISPSTDTTEADVNRALLEASHGSGHAYRVKPGSWHLEP